jgi:choline dehydrogenase
VKLGMASHRRAGQTCVPEPLLGTLTSDREGGQVSVQVEAVRAVEVPTRIVHGLGAIGRLGELVADLGLRRPLLVTDPGVAAAGLAEQAHAQVPDAVQFADVYANPDVELVATTSAIYRDEGCDGLVAVGGGSSIDTAKAVGVEVANGGSILDHEYGRTPIARRIPPLVAVPTTAGTGSEVTLWAVITDHDREIKFNVGGTPLIAAHVALLDPELTVGLPPAVTAATGMDALSHGIECFTCDYHQPFNDAVALHAIELVARWLPAALADGSNVEARTHMAHAALLGGLSYGTESAGAAHAMSQSAGGVHDCPHGALTARVLGPVCEFNAPAAPERYARIAQALGVDTAGLEPLEAAAAGVERLYRLIDDVGIPTMDELGFSEDEIPMLARIAHEDPQTIGNPRAVDVAGYEEIYCNAFGRGTR